MTAVIIASPGPVFIDPNLQSIQANATVTASGSQVVTGYGAQEVTLFINVKNAPTGTLPTLQYTIQEVDPGDGATVIGTSVSSTSINAAGIQKITLLTTYGGSIKVSWAIGGTGTPTFTGVYATVVAKLAAQMVTDGVNGPAAVKAASATAAAADPSLVVALSPNTPFAATDRAAMTAGTQIGVPSIGQSSGFATIARHNRMGMVIPGHQTLQALDVVEGTTVNTWLWTQSTTTMTIAQTTGLLTLNNGAITTTTTDAIITSNKQFALINQAPVGCSFKALVTQGTNSVNELGFGAPTGTTAIVNNGAFFRINASGTILAVTSNNGTETVSASLGTIVGTSYYLWFVWIEDGGARFIIESETGVPLVNYFAPIPLATPNVANAVSHIPAFARVYTTGTASAAPQTKIAGFEAWQYDISNNKLWGDQLAGAGRYALINPTSFAQTTSLMTAAPATETPSNTVAGYNNLGGDYAVALTTSSENPLSVFGFQIPSPYSFYLTGLQFSTPFVSTTIGVTGIPLLEWLVIANNSNGNISTGGGQKFPVGLNMVYTSATQAAGSFLTVGGSLIWSPKVPILCQPGTYLHIAYKVFVTSAAATPGVTRGSVFVDGYFE